MDTIAEKLRVLWHDLVGGRKAHIPCSFHTVLQAAAYMVKAFPWLILQIKTEENIYW